MDLYTPNDGPALQLLLLLAMVLPAVLFLRTQWKTLHVIKPENRQIRPAQVWLQLIPFIGQVWQFFVVNRIAGSIRNEMASWHTDSIFGADAVVAEEGVKLPTRSIGRAYGILNVSAILLAQIDGLGGIPGLFFLAGMVCWIIYWVQLAQYKNKLKLGLAAARG